MSTSSPISFQEFIRIDRRKKDPIYLQIVYQFIQAVQRKYLYEGLKIPGTRVLHQQLNVHRKTIVAAMEELEAQGWVEIIPNVGTFVRNSHKKQKNRTKRDDFNLNSGEKANFEFHRSFVLNSPFEKNDCPLQFNDGQPDYRLINIDELARFYGNSLKRKSVTQQLIDFSERGNPLFKEQLSYYLNLSRGFHIAKANLAVVKSKEMLMYALTQLLIKSGDTVLVGGFSYFFTNMIFQQAGATMKTIPVDKEGMDVEFIQKNFKKGDVRCVILNPKNHYPTTATLSDERRKLLLQLAEDDDFIIIEEDDDFEFHYSDTLPLPLATQFHERVLYIGGFGRFLVPSFQTEFLVAPVNLIEEIENYLRFLDPQGDVVMEQSLCEMIKEGDIYRYLRKAVKTYKQRNDQFSKQLLSHFGEEIVFQKPAGGLAVWIEFKRSFSLNKLAQKCAEDGLFIPRICMFQNAQITALRIGFAHFNSSEMEAAVFILKKAYDQVTLIE